MKSRLPSIPFLSQLFFLAFLLLPFASLAQFGSRIYIPSNVPTEVEEAVADMKHWLERAGHEKLTIQKGGNMKAKGILILSTEDKDADIPGPIRDSVNKDGQSFHLCMKKSCDVVITGSGANSIINGIYTFLHELGFRWFMPGDAWTIIPNLNDDIEISKVYTPDFRNRTYAGTGGANAIHGLDPKNTFRQDFEVWNRRNRYSMDYISKGHTGQAFYNEKKAELQNRPDLFCHNKVSVYGRIDIGKPEAVRIYTDWALSQVKPGMKYPVIGVDPADGSGSADDCLPANMPQIKNWSDKYFWLANKVAQAIPKNDDRSIVQLYAYSDHSAIPGFKLHERIHPILIPYAYQRISTPAKFIKDWSEYLDARPIGIYDYWNLVVWSHGLPNFNMFTIPEKLRLWKKFNTTTVHIEANYGKGTTGPMFWLASQLMWDTSLDLEELYTEFLEKCFGPAAPDMRRMYDRWNKRFQGATEVDLSLRDITAASQKTRDQKIQERLLELKAFVHYMRLYYEYQQNQTVANYNALVNYMYQIHPLRMVQTWGLIAYYIKKPKGVDNKVLLPPVTITAPKNLLSFVETNYRSDVAAYNKSYGMSSMEFDITKAVAISSAPTASPQFLNARNEYQFYWKGGELSLKAGSTNGSVLEIIDEEGQNVFDKKIPASAKGYTDVKVKLPRGKYGMLFGDLGGFGRLQLPDEVVFVSVGVPAYDNAGYPLQYIYVPSDATEIVYEDRLGPGINRRGFWIDPDGKRVDAQKVRGFVYRVPVPERHRGKIWTLDIGHRQFTALNIPNHFSLRKFEYKED